MQMGFFKQKYENMENTLRGGIVRKITCRINVFHKYPWSYEY